MILFLKKINLILIKKNVNLIIILKYFMYLIKSSKNFYKVLINNKVQNLFLILSGIKIT